MNFFAFFLQIVPQFVIILTEAEARASESADEKETYPMSYVDSVLSELIRKNPAQDEFIQAATEVLNSPAPGDRGQSPV